MVDIIVKKGKPRGRTRSSIEKRLEGEGWGRTMTDEQRDKSEFLERCAKEKYGADSTHFKKHHVDEVK